MNRPRPLVPKALGKSLVSKKPWRSKPYRDSVKEHPCLGCNRPAEEAHHIREALPRTMGVRVGDEWCAPLCKSCHDTVHRHSRTFWPLMSLMRINPVAWCEGAQARSPIWKKHLERIAQ